MKNSNKPRPFPAQRKCSKAKIHGVKNFLITQFLNLLITVSCFASEEIRLPDINILGEDLTIYGISDIELKKTPGDKEKYISREFKRRKFRSSAEGLKTARYSFSAGNQYFSQWMFGVSRRGDNSETGFLTTGDSKFLNTDGRKDASVSADFFYGMSEPFILKIKPGVVKRIYEVPETSGQNISVLYLNMPFSAGMSRNNIFAEVRLEPEILKGSYPGIFHTPQADVSFFSSKMSGRLNTRLGNHVISGGAFVSPNRWDWIEGEKNFMHGGFDFSVQVPMPPAPHGPLRSGGAGLPAPPRRTGGEAGITLNPSIRFEKWAGESYFLGGLVVDIPLEATSKISAGVQPHISTPGVDIFLNNNGGILKQFPKAAYDNYRSFFVNFSRSRGVLKYKLEVSHIETQNFLYLNESNSVYGTFETGEFKRYEFEASASLNFHGVMVGLREKYRTGGDLLFAARNEFSGFCEMSAGKFDFNFLGSAVSKKKWVSGYVRSSVKICYNLTQNFRIFCTGNNVFGDEIYRSRYEFLDVPVFMTGIEAKF